MRIFRLCRICRLEFCGRIDHSSQDRKVLQELPLKGLYHRNCLLNSMFRGHVDLDVQKVDLW